MDFLRLYDGFFDITSRSLRARHARERHERRRRLEESLIQNGDLNERLESLERWIEARRRLREAQENLASSTQINTNEVLDALTVDRNNILGDLWNTTAKADAQGHLPHTRQEREIAHAR